MAACARAQLNTFSMHHRNAQAMGIVKNRKPSATMRAIVPKRDIEEVTRGDTQTSGFNFMPHGSSQVVGLIEVDDVASLPAWSARVTREQPARTHRVHSQPSCGTAEYVEADLGQINSELRVELARVVARITKARSRN